MNAKMTNLLCVTRKISFIFYAWILLSWASWPALSASPVMMANGHQSPSSQSLDYGVPVSSEEEVVLPLDAVTAKSILLYNRLNQLVQKEPEILELLDVDRGHLSRIIDELVMSNQIRSKKFLNVKSSKRAAAMGVDLPDYILHINKGRNFDFSSFREKMQKSG